MKNMEFQLSEVSMLPVSIRQMKKTGKRNRYISYNYKYCPNCNCKNAQKNISCKQCDITPKKWMGRPRK